MYPKIDCLRRTIFVGGITGSGKTTTCTTLAELLDERVKVIYIGGIACTLASANRLATASIEQATSQNLDRCQHLVVEHISNIQNSMAPDTTFILDGHFVLGGIERPTYCLPKWFFARLGVNELILCDPPVSDIRKRIHTDSKRIRPPLVVNSLEYYTEFEAKHAKAISEQLQLPLVIVDSSEASALDKIIPKSLLQKPWRDSPYC